MSGDMFEGKDYPTQWALNPSAYQNMNNDQVDWAALAQQWIKMKEIVVPPAPPPPTIDPLCPVNDGGGEAPMDMDPKEDDVPPAPPAPNISGSAEAWNQWSQWGSWNTSSSGAGSWEWSSIPPPGVTVGPDGKPMEIPTVPVIPPAPSISSTPEFNIPSPAAPSLYSYNSVPPTQPYNQVSNYWAGEPPNTVPPQQPSFMKNIRHPSRMPHMRAMDSVRYRDDREKTPEEDTTATIDAAKRRQLPAWIREGLEKMEREKQKAVERERQEILRKQELEARKQAEDEARAVFNPAKSKFDSDSEKETEQESEVVPRRQEAIEKSYDHTPDVVLRPRKSRFRDADSPDSHTVVDGSPQSLSTAPSNSMAKRSREEMLQDVVSTSSATLVADVGSRYIADFVTQMLKVRRSLTEILLEVTNEEIGSVCREVWTRARSKGEPPAASLNNTAPLAQITRKLGLGIYGDSNSESEEEQNEPEQLQTNDSDEELLETLRRRQQAFKKTEEEIEARLAEEEEKDQQNYEDSYAKQQDNHTGNTSCKEPVDEKETVNNQRDDASEALSSGGHSPKEQNVPTGAVKAAATPSRSADSESSSSESTSSDSSYVSLKKSKKTSKSSYREHRKRNSKSRSESRSKASKSRSPERTRKRKSRSRSAKSSRKGYRSRSSSNYRSGKKHRSRSRNRRRARSRSKNCRRSSSTSTSRKWSRSHSVGKRKSRSHSRDRKRSRSRSPRRSKSRTREKRRTRSRSQSRSRAKERSRSRSKQRTTRRSRSYVSRSRRRSRSRSRDHRRSRSKSRQSNHRDGKKSSSHRYRN